MPAIYITGLCILLTASPYHILAYYPFRDRLRISTWLVITITGFIQVIQLLLTCFAIFTGHDYRVVEFIFTLVYIVLYIYLVKAEVSKVLFIFIFITDYVMLVKGLSAFLEANFFHTTQTVLSRHVLSVALHILLLCLTAPFVLKFLNHMREQVFRTYAPTLWKTLWMVPSLTTFIVLIFTWDINTVNASHLSFLAARLCLLPCIIVVYYILIGSLDIIRSQAEADERNLYKEQLIALQYCQYLLIQKQIEETREARHNLKQHLKMIKVYLEKGDNDSLKKYIDKYGEKLPVSSCEPYCSNYAIDVLIRYYAEQAEEAGIDFKAQLLLPEKLAIYEPDICVLFGNLLEQAVKACKQSLIAAPFIRVNARLAGGQALSITVDHSCIMPMLPQSGTTGILSVRNIVTRYHGLSDFKYENGVSYVSVFLNP